MINSLSPRRLFRSLVFSFLALLSQLLHLQLQIILFLFLQGKRRRRNSSSLGPAKLVPASPLFGANQPQPTFQARGEACSGFPNCETVLFRATLPSHPDRRGNRQVFPGASHPTTLSRIYYSSKPPKNRPVVVVRTLEPPPRSSPRRRPPSRH